GGEVTWSRAGHKGKISHQGATAAFSPAPPAAALTPAKSNWPLSGGGNRAEQRAFKDAPAVCAAEHVFIEPLWMRHHAQDAPGLVRDAGNISPGTVRARFRVDISSRIAI